MRNTTLCYIERGEQYLMLHRVKKENDLNHDKWVGIGGKFEGNETPDECLLREAYEETGLTLTDWRCRGVVTFLSDEWEGEYMYLFTAGGFTGTLRECNEGVLSGSTRRPCRRCRCGRATKFSSVCWRRTRRFSCSSCATRATRSSRLHSTARRFRFEKPIHDREEPYMRRKQQIQAMQQELALLRQTVDSGKELAALAADAAGQLRRPGLRTVAVQVMRSPRVRRAVLIAGGTVTAVTLGAAAVHCRVYQAIVAQEVKKALKPVNARLDALQATVDAVAEAEGVAPDKAHKSKKHSR